MTGAASPGWAAWDEVSATQPATPIDDEIAGYDMLYSSGTTGRPKGVLRPFKNEPISNIAPTLVALCIDFCGMATDSVNLSPAPLYHAAPLRFNMMSARLGGTSVIMEKFDAENYLRLVERHKATHSQLVPTMFVRLLKLPELDFPHFRRPSIESARLDSGN
jgi:acyl-CoA synthetase (AMP-forming)/AMP-acid ligase II